MSADEGGATPICVASRYFNTNQCSYVPPSQRSGEGNQKQRPAQWGRSSYKTDGAAMADSEAVRNGQLLRLFSLLLSSRSQNLVTTAPTTSWSRASTFFEFSDLRNHRQGLQGLRMPRAHAWRAKTAPGASPPTPVCVCVCVCVMHTCIHAYMQICTHTF